METLILNYTKSIQSCPTLCDPMDCSLAGSFVHWIFQARILEWVAMSSSRGSSHPRDRTHVSYVSCIGRWVLYYERHCIGEFFVFSAQFCYDTKTTLKFIREKEYVFYIFFVFK